MRDLAAITQPQYAVAMETPIELEPGSIYTRIREPFFFSFVRDQLIAEYGANRRSGRTACGSTRRSTRASSGSRQGDPRDADERHRSGLRDRLHQPRERRDPGDGVGAAGHAEHRSSTSRHRAAGRRGRRSRRSSSPRRSGGASTRTRRRTSRRPFTYQPDPNASRGAPKTYDDTYYGASADHRCHASLRQLGVRALTLDLGPESVVSHGARRWACARRSSRWPSIGLGSNDVSVLDMASAYATLAAGGIYSPADGDPQGRAAERQVDTRGPAGARPQRKRVIPDGVAYQVTRILEQNVLAGTGTRAYFGRPAAGKTGTTDDLTDAWFAGYTPTLADRCLGRLPERHDRDDERPRDRGRRRLRSRQRSGTCSCLARSRARR